MIINRSTACLFTLELIWNRTKSFRLCGLFEMFFYYFFLSTHPLGFILPSSKKERRERRSRQRERRKRRSWRTGGSLLTSTISMRTKWSKDASTSIIFHRLISAFCRVLHYRRGLLVFCPWKYSSFLLKKGEGQWAVAVADDTGGWEVWPHRETEETEIWCKYFAPGVVPVAPWNDDTDETHFYRTIVLFYNNSVKVRKSF